MPLGNNASIGFSGSSVPYGAGVVPTKPTRAQILAPNTVSTIAADFDYCILTFRALIECIFYISSAPTPLSPSFCYYNPNDGPQQILVAAGDKILMVPMT